MKTITGLFKKPKIAMPTPTAAPTGPDAQQVAEEAQRERIKQQQARRGRFLTMSDTGSSSLTGGGRSTLG